MTGETGQHEVSVSRGLEETERDRIRTKIESLLNVPVAPPGWLEGRQEFQHTAKEVLTQARGAAAMIFDIKGAKNLSGEEIGTCFQQLAEALEQLGAEQTIVRRTLGSDEAVVVVGFTHNKREGLENLLAGHEIAAYFHTAVVLNLDPKLPLRFYLGGLDAALSFAKEKRGEVARVTWSPDQDWQVVDGRGERIGRLEVPAQEEINFPCETEIFVETYNDVRNRLKKLVSERGDNLPIVIVDIPNFSELNGQTQSFGTCVLANIANSLCSAREEIALVAKLGTMFLVVPESARETNLVGELLKDPIKHMNLENMDLTVSRFTLSMAGREFRLGPSVN